VYSKIEEFVSPLIIKVILLVSKLMNLMNLESIVAAGRSLTATQDMGYLIISAFSNEK